jgi:2'-5' RNA ligase
MPYAVTLCLDAAGAAAIRRLWDALATAGIGDVPALGYVPHVTLGIWPDTSDVAALRGGAARVAARRAAPWVTFSALGVFPGNPAVLFAAPVVTGTLLRWHADLLDGLAPPHPHYRPDAWMPHVTLAEELAGHAAAAAALALAAPHWAPFRCRLDRVDLVHFRPVDVLWSQALK